MRLSERIALHPPHLRRFARLLSGSQSGGDAYVAAAIESIADHPTSFSTDADTRVALYRLLIALWDSVPMNRSTPTSLGARLAGENRLEALTPRPRQAFLLRTVEEFSTLEAANIMGVSEIELDRMLALACKEIAGEVATTVLIIEDEPLIAIDLQSIVEALGHRVVLAVICSSQTPSLRLHERYGFTPAGLLREVGYKFDRWLDIAILQKLP